MRSLIVLALAAGAFLLSPAPADACYHSAAVVCADCAPAAFLQQEVVTQYVPQRVVVERVVVPQRQLIQRQVIQRQQVLRSQAVGIDAYGGGASLSQSINHGGALGIGLGVGAGDDGRVFKQRQTSRPARRGLFGRRR